MTATFSLFLTLAFLHVCAKLTCGLLTRAVAQKVKVSLSKTQLSSFSGKEQFSHPLPALSTVKVVEAARKSQTHKDYVMLSPADLVQLSGAMDLREAQKELSALGYVTGASLSVNEEGDIVYCFPASKSIIKAVSEKSRALQVKTIVEERIIPFGFKCTKFVFGMFLISSLALAATAAVAVAAAAATSSSSSSRSSSRSRSSSQDDNDDDNSGGRRSFSFSSMRLARVLLSDTVDVARYSSRTTASKIRTRKIFVSSFYSFVFGDKNPNEDFEYKQLRAAVSCIRANDGIVCAEQLAPCLNPPNISKVLNSHVVEESWMLDTVIKLEGVPLVTEDGDIIYDFSNVVESKFAYLPSEDKAYKESFPFYESPLPFSDDCESLNPVRAVVGLPGALGLLNVFGVSYIRSVLSKRLLVAAYPGLHTLLSGIFPALLAYSVFYLAAPTVRGLYLSKLNKEIEERNINRKEWNDLIKSEKKAPFLTRKLSAIKSFVKNRAHNVK